MSIIDVDVPAETGVGHGPAALHETHSAYVVLIGDTARKIKKPVRTAFLDFRDVESRRHACMREFVLNSRFAPDIYLGVSDLTDPMGGPPEPVLTMRRLPDASRLSTLAASGEELSTVLDVIAHRLAAIHKEGPRSLRIDEGGSHRAVSERWLSNLAELRSLSCESVEQKVVDEIELHTNQYLGGREALFNRRIAEGRVIDGHGDLLSDDIFVLPDGPRILDCLDFDDALRFIDGLDDICCLAMDLEYQGRPDLADVFVDHYRAASADNAPKSLVHHYISYRSFMRAKVACIRCQQGDVQARTDVAQHLSLALRHARATSLTLALVGGLPGSGKTTLSRSLASRTGAVVLSSDIVRKETAGVDPAESQAADVDHGMYSPEAVAGNYADLLQRARRFLSEGRSVIIDASWSDSTMRSRAAEVASTAHADLSEYVCAVPQSVAIHRVLARTGGPSDATIDVYEALSARWSPWRTATEIDTGSSAGAAAAAAHSVWGRNSHYIA